jgi:hypothetical protein
VWIHFLCPLLATQRQKSMSSAGFEPIIPASEWPQTYALGRAAIRNMLLRDIVNYIFTDNRCVYCKIEWQGGVSCVVILKKCY